MKFFNQFMLFSMTVLLVWSCSKNDVVNIEETVSQETTQALKTLPNLEDVTIQEGRLVFKSFDHYEDILDDLSDYQDVFDQLPNQFEGFVSSTQAYEELTYEEFEANGIEAYSDFLYLETEDDGMKSAIPAIFGSFSDFANSKGLIQFGSKVWKIKHTEVDEFEVSELSSYIQGDFQSMRTLVTNPIITEITTRNFWGDQCDEEYTISRRRKRRIIGNIKIILYTSGRTEMTVQNIHQLRRVGIWWGDKADLTIDGSAIIDLVLLNQPSQLGVQESINFTATNKKNFEELVRSCKSGCDFSFTSVNVNYDAVDGLGGANCDCDR